MKKIRIFASALLLVGVLSGCTLLYPNWGKPTDSPKPTESQTPGPTETKTETPKPKPTDKAKADVEIMDAYADTANGILVVIAQVTNFSEDGGTCKATFNGGGKTVSLTGSAESNAANTQCRPIEIPLGGLPKGAGVVTVSYESATKYGTSTSFAVTIE
ncbi:MAG: hypothetical protein EBR26_05350 [Microbacteriaceae bacterium]|nr:hypothetical protein [Microbacteriaceae bacterium]